MVKINDLAGYTNPNTISYERMKYYIGNTNKDIVNLIYLVLVSKIDSK